MTAYLNVFWPSWTNVQPAAEADIIRARSGYL